MELRQIRAQLQPGLFETVTRMDLQRLPAIRGAALWISPSDRFYPLLAPHR